MPKSKVICLDIICVTLFNVMAKRLSVFSVVLNLPGDEAIYRLLKAAPEVYRPDLGGSKNSESEKKIADFLISVPHRLCKGASTGRLVYRDEFPTDYIKCDWFLENPPKILGENLLRLSSGPKDGALHHLSGNPVGRDVLRSMVP